MITRSQSLWVKINFICPPTVERELDRIRLALAGVGVGKIIAKVNESLRGTFSWLANLSLMRKRMSVNGVSLETRNKMMLSL